MIDLIGLRRTLHQNPELALDLPVTRQLLLDALAPLGLAMHTSASCSSLAVVVSGAEPGPTVLLRADMDGLPVVEESGEEFSSANGHMHACGHDLHMAGLVGAIHQLHRRRAEFAGDVLAVFQPGEEGAGGAELMIGEKTHLLTGRKPVASYGLHVLSFAETGVFFCREGAVMGAAMLFELELLGRGGHAARPHTALDPVSTAALVRDTVAELYGAGRYRELVVPEMISEDFSQFLDETGGAFVLVGAAVGDQSRPLPTNHSPEARFDDSVVPDMSSLLADLAIRRLNAEMNGTAC